MIPLVVILMTLSMVILVTAYARGWLHAPGHRGFWIVVGVIALIGVAQLISFLVYPETRTLLTSVGTACVLAYMLLVDRRKFDT